MDGLDVHYHDGDPFGPALDLYQIQFAKIRDNQVKEPEFKGWFELDRAIREEQLYTR